MPTRPRPACYGHPALQSERAPCCPAALCSPQAQGEWTEEEHRLFVETARAHGVGDKWGLFASYLPQVGCMPWAGCLVWNVSVPSPSGWARALCHAPPASLPPTWRSAWATSAPHTTGERGSSTGGARKRRPELWHPPLARRAGAAHSSCRPCLCVALPRCHQTLRLPAARCRRDVAIPQGLVLDRRYRMTRGGKAVFVG